MSETVRIAIMVIMGALMSYGFAVGVAYGIKFGCKSQSGYFKWAWVMSIVGFLAWMVYIIVGFHLV